MILREPRLAPRWRGSAHARRRAARSLGVGAACSAAASRRARSPRAGMPRRRLRGQRRRPASPARGEATLPQIADPDPRHGVVAALDRQHGARRSPGDRRSSSLGTAGPADRGVVARTVALSSQRAVAGRSDATPDGGSCGRSTARGRRAARRSVRATARTRRPPRRSTGSRPRASARLVAARRTGRRSRLPKLTVDVAQQVGLNFRQGAFRYGVSGRPAGDDGRRPLLARLQQRRLDGPLRRQLVRGRRICRTGRRTAGCRAARSSDNVHGRFVNVSKASGAGLQVQGTGCVAADFNGDGYTDLFVTTATDDVLLWNNGNGTFTEGARSSGHRLVRLALRRGGRRRERRRPARPVRRRLHEHASSRSRARSPASRRTTRACATSCS